MEKATDDAAADICCQTVRNWGSTITMTLENETININDASPEALTSLTGIGPALAARIVQYRAEKGPFSDADSLAQVRGISQRMVAAFEPRLVVAPAPAERDESMEPDGAASEATPSAVTADAPSDAAESTPPPAAEENRNDTDASAESPPVPTNGDGQGKRDADDIGIRILEPARTTPNSPEDLSNGAAATAPAGAAAEPATPQPQIIYAAPPPAPRPGFWRRLGQSIAWSVVTTVKLIFSVVIIALLVAGGWYAVTIVDDIQERLLKLEIGSELSADANKDQTLAQIATDVELAALNDRIETLGTETDSAAAALQADLADQAALLATLDVQAGSLISRTEQLDESVTSLMSSLTLLQSDVVSNTAQLGALSSADAALGANVSSVETSLAGLQSDVTALLDAEAELIRIRQAVTLFQAWDVVARARLHLLENNPGLAAADVTVAQAILAQLVTDEPSTATALAPVQQRLLLASAALGAGADGAAPNTATATRDLDTAWELLGAAVTGLVQPRRAVLPPTPTPAAADEVITPTPAPAEASPTPTETPAASAPTATPAP